MCSQSHKGYAARAAITLMLVLLAKKHTVNCKQLDLSTSAGLPLTLTAGRPGAGTNSCLPVLGKTEQPAGTWPDASVAAWQVPWHQGLGGQQHGRWLQWGLLSWHRPQLREKCGHGDMQTWGSSLRLWKLQQRPERDVPGQPPTQPTARQLHRRQRHLAQGGPCGCVWQQHWHE